MFFHVIIQAQNVNIPDVNFKNALINTNCVDSDGNGNYDSDADTNNDGEIQVAEAQAVIKLNLYYTGITDVTGINAFVNLVELDCWENVGLSTVSISNLNNLEKLNLNGNLALTNLNLSNLNSLRKLTCSGSNISTLDLTGLVSLKEFECYSGQLTAINITNLSNLEELNLVGNNLTSIDFSGVSNLKTLYCSSNQLATLNLSPLIILENLQCTNNLLSNLNLANNSMLKSINCSNNNLSSINVSGLSNLENFDLSNNQMTTISLNGLVGLKNLNCGYNQFTNLNLSGLTSLQGIICSNNQLSNLDFSGLLNLIGVDCSNNSLWQLDFSGNPLFGDLNCSNNLLNYINIKNGLNHFNPDNLWSTNTNLVSICIDEGEQSMINWILGNSTDITDPALTSYCTFTPGGNYNTISGVVKFDSSNDGCDALDLPQPFIKVKIGNPVETGAGFVTANGNYTFYTQAGSFTVTPDVENPSFFNFSPANASIIFPDNNNNVVMQNFCMTANGVHPDLEVVIAPVFMARPGFDAYYAIVYKNKGNQMLSGNVVLNFNDAVLNLISSIPSPDIQNFGQYTFNFTNLMPFENRIIVLGFHVNSPLDTPAVNGGDVLNFSVAINPVLGDEMPNDNQFVYNQTVVNACDPNNKICLEGELESPVKIGDYLHYTINFENIGNADAVNVVVKDVIDTTQFDERSLQVLGSSHPVQAKIKGNVAEFIFQNINLAPGNGNGGGGHGNILLKIKTKNNLVAGDQVANKASIYFDYNAPIETEFATTTFQSLSLNDHVIDQTIAMYPNPTNSLINIKSKGLIKTIELFDVQGRILQTMISEQSNEVLDLSTYSTGVYFVRVNTDKGIKVEKVLKK